MLERSIRARLESAFFNAPGECRRETIELTLKDATTPF
jgi:hypothetical protein